MRRLRDGVDSTEICLNRADTFAQFLFHLREFVRIAGANVDVLRTLFDKLFGASEADTRASASDENSFTIKIVCCHAASFMN